jgi:MFS transporter, DHA2 family, methylenomycin A resistance protein
MRVSTARYEAFEAGAPHSGSRLATSLTLAAMSLGYGVVQLDVTIVNTALDAMGRTLGGGVAELQWVVSA